MVIFHWFVKTNLVVNWLPYIACLHHKNVLVFGGPHVHCTRLYLNICMWKLIFSCYATQFNNGKISTAAATTTTDRPTDQPCMHHISLLNKISSLTHTYTHTRTRTHARAHTNKHAHTQNYNFKCQDRTFIHNGPKTICIDSHAHLRSTSWDLWTGVCILLGGSGVKIKMNNTSSTGKVWSRVRERAPLLLIRIWYDCA